MKAILVGIAVLVLPVVGGASPVDAQPIDALTVSPAVKCLQPRRPADPAVPVPKVVSTFPARGAVVRPGVLIVRITFDLPMACGGTFLDAPPFASPFPDGDRRVVLTQDRRTFRILGHVRHNARYGFWMNLGPFPDFRNLAGQPLAPYAMNFTTTSGPAVKTIAEAMAQDVEAPPAK